MDDVTGLADDGLRPLTAALLINSFPALARQFKPIPRGYFATLSEYERVVACPCSRRPVLGLGELKSCEHARLWVPVRGDVAPCPRTYIATNRSVLVTGTPDGR